MPSHRTVFRTVLLSISLRIKRTDEFFFRVCVYSLRSLLLFCEFEKICRAFYVPVCSSGFLLLVIVLCDLSNSQKKRELSLCFTLFGTLQKKEEDKAKLAAFFARTNVVHDNHFECIYAHTIWLMCKDGIHTQTISMEKHANNKWEISQNIQWLKIAFVQLKINIHHKRDSILFMFYSRNSQLVTGQKV